MRCVYCHDTWTDGYTCSCGAVYHTDCMEFVCVTIGCQETSEEDEPVVFTDTVDHLSNFTLESLSSWLYSG